MIFILDFDYTLCHTKAFEKVLLKSVKKFKVTDKLFFETYKKTVEAIPGEYDYDVKKHAVFLAKATGRDKLEIENALRQTVKKIDRFLFTDSLPSVRWLKKYGKIIIHTWGNPKWQKTKITNSLIMKYANRCIYTKKEKKTLKFNFYEPPENLVFINDNPKEIKEMMRLFPKSTHLRVKRPEGKKFDPKWEKLEVKTFKNLNGIKNYIEDVLRSRV